MFGEGVSQPPVLLSAELRAPGLSLVCFKKDFNHTCLHRFDLVTEISVICDCLLLTRYKYALCMYVRMYVCMTYISAES